MNKNLIVIFLILITAMGQEEIDAQTPITGKNGYVSIKDFGAVGDGKTDDTKAIQEAIDYAQKQGHSQQNVPGAYDSYTIYFGAAKTAFFPTGIYIISAPLKAGSYLHFLGEKAVLVSSKTKTRAIDAIQVVAWQANIEGLQYVGFNNALKLNNNNIDLGKITISNCDFMDNNKAIQLEATSSIAIIRENRFFNNAKVLDDIICEKIDMRDNWIIAASLKGTHDAQIINGQGVLHFGKNLIVPVPPQKGAIEPSRINNYGTVTIDGTKQGGEPGSFTLVNNFAKFIDVWPVTPNAVVITNSDCYAVYSNQNGYFAPAALRLVNVPNSIVLKDLMGMPDANLIDFTQTSDNTGLGTSKYKNYSVVIKVENASGTMHHPNGSEVPNELQRFVINKICWDV